MSIEAALTIAVAISVLGYVASIWHGDRQYKQGLRDGRDRERREATRARDRVVSDVQLMMIDAGLKRINEKYGLEEP